MAYADMSEADLMDQYNRTLSLYYQGQNSAHAYRQMVADAARSIYDKNIDMTRPMYSGTDISLTIKNEKHLKYAKQRDPDRDWKIGDVVPAERKSKVYVPGGTGYEGGEMKRTHFAAIMKALKNGKGINWKGTKIANKNIRAYFGIDESWGMDRDGNFHIATTDNTCAMYTCTVLDMAAAQHKESELGKNFELHLSKDGKEFNSKNMTADEWAEFLKAQAGKYINTAGYYASPEKIMKATAENEETWSTYNMDDFQKDVPEGERLDPYSQEYWDKYIKPGDMIIYHTKGVDPSKTSQHIAIAGHDGLQIYHDGSTTHNVKKNSQNKNHAYYKNRKGYKHFTIVRHTNQTELDKLEAMKNQIEQEISNRNIVNASNWEQDENGYFVDMTVDPLPLQKIELVNNVEDPKEITVLDPIDIPADTDNNPNRATNSQIQHKPGIFKQIGQWVHNTFNKKDKKPKKNIAQSNDQSNTNTNQQVTPTNNTTTVTTNNTNTPPANNNLALNTLDKNIEKDLG